MLNTLKFITLVSLTGLIVVSSPVFADDILDPYQYSSNTDSPLDKPYIVSKVFSSMSQVVSLLNNNGISSVQKNKQQNEPINQSIKVNSTFRDFINKAAQSFGYSWTLQGNTVVFTAITPILPKILPSPAPESALTPKIITPIVIPKAATSAPVAIESKEAAKPITLPDRTAVLTKSSESGFARSQGEKVWELNSADKTIRIGLSRWATKAGWQLIWKANYDMPVEASVSIPGTFEFAVNEVCRASQYTGKQLIAEMHDKNKVIVIYTPAK